MLKHAYLGETLSFGFPKLTIVVDLCPKFPGKFRANPRGNPRNWNLVPSKERIVQAAEEAGGSSSGDDQEQVGAAVQDAGEMV